MEGGRWCRGRGRRSSWGGVSTGSVQGFSPLVIYVYLITGSVTVIFRWEIHFNIYKIILISSVKPLSIHIHNNE